MPALRAARELGAGGGGVAVGERPEIGAGGGADLPLVGAGFDRAPRHGGDEKCECGEDEEAASDTSRGCQVFGHVPTVRARRPVAIGPASDLGVLLGHGLASASPSKE